MTKLDFTSCQATLRACKARPASCPSFTFTRYEAKYLLEESQYNAIRGFLAAMTVPDRHAEYKVNNIYYDSRDFAIIRHSIEKPTPIYKEKLRLRYYDNDSAGEQGVFLELKKKFNGIVYKRRIMLPQKHDAERFLRSGESDELGDSENYAQVAREIRAFIATIPDIDNEIAISYRRTALSGNDSVDDLRITFDTELFFENSDGKHRLLPANLRLMEVKTATAMPMSLARYLSENRIFPRSFSKYGTAYKDYIYTV
jgi:hypothetical protein